MADLPYWVKAEIEAGNDPKVLVSLRWLIGLAEKAGVALPEDLLTSTLPEAQD